MRRTARKQSASVPTNLCPNCNKGLLPSKFKLGYGYCPNYKSCGYKGGKMSFTENNMSKTVTIIKPLADPSEEQAAIFKWAYDFDRHGIIEALAGTGKTTVLVQLVRIFAERKKTVMCVAFSRRDKNTLEERVGQTAKIYTNNGAGLGLLSVAARSMGVKLNVNDSVGYELLRSLWEEEGHIPKKKGDKWELPAALFNAILQLVDKVRTTLPLSSSGPKTKPTDEDFADICQRFDIEVKSEHVHFLYHYGSVLFSKLASLGTAWAHGVDFAGQLFLPVYHGMRSKTTYDKILVDEAQDQNYYTRQLVLAYCHSKTNIIAVGDRRQAIYSWRGADTSAITELGEMLRDFDTFPLTLCRRCPDNVINAARCIVPTIKGLGTNPGKVDTIDDDAKLFDRLCKDKKGWVICRANAPNISMCLRLLAKGVKALMSRSNIVSELINLIDTCGGDDNCKVVDLMRELDAWLFDKQTKLATSINGGKKLQIYQDKVDCIKALCECTTIKNVGDIKNKINELFPAGQQPDPNEMVVFSTVHGSKGGEAKNVYLYSPHTNKGSLWDQVWGSDANDRDNVLYVAITRSEDYLCYAGAAPKLERMSAL